jgi:hypothetical protein
MKLELRVADRTADLQELVAGLEAFNRSVSHDLQGPLSGIADLAGLANDALAKGSPDLALRSRPVITKQACTSKRLVTTLLELACVGSAPLRYGKTRLDDLVQETFDSLRLTANEPLPVLSFGALPEVVTDTDLLRLYWQAQAIDHAYARTTFKEQGATNRHEITMVSGTGAKIFNKEAAYVGATRAKVNTEVITSDHERLLKNAGNDVSKQTALRSPEMKELLDQVRTQQAPIVQSATNERAAQRPQKIQELTRD